MTPPTNQELPAPVSALTWSGRTPARLTVLYDAECSICVRFKRWLEQQPQIVPLLFEPYQAALASGRFSGLAAMHPEREVCVVSNDGCVWRGDAAWILCLYALCEYRTWSFRLSTPTLRPLARTLCTAISANRMKISRWLGRLPIPELQAERRRGEPICVTNRCER